MIHIQKTGVPDFLITFTEKNPAANYDSESFKPLYQRLRAHLVNEQKGLCAYCCARITVDNSHNEHIEPRHKKDGSYSVRSLDYGNIVASCNSDTTCGKHKENDYDEKRFVSPLQADCESGFSYDPDGYMHGDEYTISLLNLNSYGLQKARRSVYKAIMGLSAEEIRLIYCSNPDQLWPYSNVIFWFLREFEGT